MNATDYSWSIFTVKEINYVAWAAAKHVAG